VESNQQIRLSWDSLAIEKPPCGETPQSGQVRFKKTQ
jgi:hypothetical protein